MIAKLRRNMAQSTAELEEDECGRVARGHTVCGHTVA